MIHKYTVTTSVTSRFYKLQVFVSCKKQYLNRKAVGFLMNSIKYSFLEDFRRLYIRELPRFYIRSIGRVKIANISFYVDISHWWGCTKIVQSF